MSDEDGFFVGLTGGLMLGVIIACITANVSDGMVRLEAVKAHVGRYVVTPDGTKTWVWGVWEEESN